MKTRLRFTMLVALMVAGLLTSASVVSAESAQGGDPAEVRLPKPKTTGGMALTEALAKRRSHKSLAGKELSIEQISQLCWAAQGITEPKRGLRTAPSAFALYSITVFIVNDKGVYEYLPKGHLLGRLGAGNMLERLREAAKGQTSVGTARVCMVLAMDVGRLEPRCGAQAERYCLMESGHVAQNVLLQATAMGLVSVPVGGVDEAKVAAALKLPKHLRPVYLLPLGYAKAK